MPTPLWLARLFLFIPGFMLNLTVIAATLILSSMLVFPSVLPILKVEEKGRATLLSGSTLLAGMVARAMMKYLTLLFWSIRASR